MLKVIIFRSATSLSTIFITILALVKEIFYVKSNLWLIIQKVTHFKRAYQIGIKHLKYSNEGKLLLLQEHWDFKELLLITFIKIITLLW